MCGKAWMCGMVPYVDFTDSKGPLLWLIYGLGYLISHHSYIGVFWISILFYTVTLFAAYKLCRLFAGKDVSAVSVAALPFFLFCFVFRFEMKAESFCYPFIMLSLYCTCRILKYRDSDTRTYFKLSALMGICSMCCVLIKYNVGCMIMGLMAVVLYMAIKHKAGWQSFWGMAIGFVVPAVPFVICFLIYGNMETFIHEYFLNTLATKENGLSILKWFRPFKRNIIHYCILLIIFWGVFRFSQKNNIGYWLIFCFVLFVIGTGVYSLTHYYRVLMPFSIFIILLIANITINKIPLLKEKEYVIALCMIIMTLSMGVNLSIFYFNFKRKIDVNIKSGYYTAAYIMSQINNPKVMYDCIDWGVGLTANSLPACRYWIRQTGATDEMKKEAEDALKSKVADFVFMVNPNEEKVKELENYGYIYYCIIPTYLFKTDDYKLSLFGRPGLKLPPEDFHVSQWDVWLKRNIFGI